MLPPAPRSIVEVEIACVKALGAALLAKAEVEKLGKVR